MYFINQLLFSHGSIFNIKNWHSWEFIIKLAGVKGSLISIYFYTFFGNTQIFSWEFN